MGSSIPVWVQCTPLTQPQLLPAPLSSYYSFNPFNYPADHALLRIVESCFSVLLLRARLPRPVRGLSFFFYSQTVLAYVVFLNRSRLASSTLSDDEFRQRMERRELRQTVVDRGIDGLAVRCGKMLSFEEKRGQLADGQGTIDSLASGAGKLR